ncbi:MAG: hypothetical protein RLZZ84_2281 [Pseudomonadota bacterium]|jgi:predicted aspartyl protease
MPAFPLPALLVPLLAAISLSASPAGGQPTGTADVIAIKRDAADHMTVPVRLGNQGPFRFLIDTGSQNTVLSTKLALKLNLQPTSTATLIGFAGSQRVNTVELDQLDLGRRSYYSLLAPLLDNADMGADGILGLDSLQGQRVLIDFRKGTIAIDDALSLRASSAYEIVVTARRKSGQLIMADATVDGIKVSVVIDTGAETSVGNHALRDALAHRSQGRTTVLHSVTGQDVVADVGFARALRLADMTFSNVLIAYVDAPPFQFLGLEQKPALFLGMRDLRALNRLAIDFSARRIFFDLPDDAF